MNLTEGEGNSFRKPGISEDKSLDFCHWMLTLVYQRRVCAGLPPINPILTRLNW